MQLSPVIQPVRCVCRRMRHLSGASIAASRHFSTMAEKQYTSRRDDNEKTLFDYLGAEVDVNLKLGTPGEDLFNKSREHMKKAALIRLDEPDASQLFQYGPEAGDKDFRKALADFLTQEYMDPVQVDDLVVTNGASQGLTMLASLFFSAGDLVFVENPSYFAALHTFQQDLGLKCISSPMDGEGIIPDELEQRLEANVSTRPREVGGNRPFWSMLYLIPTFHNPTGVCLSPERCKRIVDIARKYNLLVVCDDVYNLLAFSQDEESSLHRKRLFAYDNPSDPDFVGNVVSNASFSKVFSPGIRLGWLEAPPNVRQRIMNSGQILSGGGLNHFTSGIMTTVITQGLLRQHLNESRLVFKNQCEALCSTLRKKLPLATFTEPQGGYFVWIQLPEPLKAADVLHRCERELKISFFTGDVASINSQFKDHVRIGFTYYEVDVLIAAISKMANLICSMLKN